MEPVRHTLVILVILNSRNVIDVFDISVNSDGFN